MCEEIDGDTHIYRERDHVRRCGLVVVSLPLNPSPVLCSPPINYALSASTSAPRTCTATGVGVRTSPKRTWPVRARGQQPPTTTTCSAELVPVSVIGAAAQVPGHPEV